VTGAQKPGDKNPVTGRWEDVKKIDFKICSELGDKKIAPGCRLSDCWDVGKHLGSKIKSRKLKETKKPIFSHLPDRTITNELWLRE
jgi:hypothetical protein